MEFLKYHFPRLNLWMPFQHPLRNHNELFQGYILTWKVIDACGILVDLAVHCYGTCHIHFFSHKHSVSSLENHFILICMLNRAAMLMKVSPGHSILATWYILKKHILLYCNVTYTCLCRVQWTDLSP